VNVGWGVEPGGTAHGVDFRGSSVGDRKSGLPNLGGGVKKGRPTKKEEFGGGTPLKGKGENKDLHEVFGGGITQMTDLCP